MRARILNASAGSGKTYQLAYKYVRDVVRQPTLYRHILAVTFTNKATEEMKTRILKEIHRLASNRPSDYLSSLCRELQMDEPTLRNRAKEVRTRILHDYSRFTVLTIDRFFQRILRAFIKELGIDLNYNLELETASILAKSADTLIEQLTTDKELARWLAAFVSERIEEGRSWDVREGILSLGGELFKERNRQAIASARSKQDLSRIVGEMTRRARISQEEFRATAERATAAIAAAGLTPADFSGSSRSFAFYFVRAASGERKAPTATVRRLSDCDEGWCAKGAPDEARALVAQLRPLLAELCARYDRDVKLWNTADLLRENYRSYALLSDLYARVQELCGNENTMLLSETKNILSTFIGRNDAPFIYEKVGNRYERYMIDEFQDTSQREWENFLPLLQNAMAQAEEVSVLLVGDIKQSIYRWRGGDWRILHEGAQQALGAETTEVIALQENFRSLPAVVAFDNRMIAGVVGRANEALNAELLVAEQAGAIAPEVRTELHDTLKRAYAGHAQRPCKSDTRTGEVCVETFQGQPPLVPTICEVLDKGYRPGEIMVLVRSANDGRKAADALLEFRRTNTDPRYAFDVMTQDALQVGYAPVSSFVVAALRLSVDPEDSIRRAVYNRYLGDRTVDRPLDDKELAFFRSLRLLSPEEAFERIVMRFSLGGRTGETAYLQALHEELIAFSTGRVADIPLFLQWWDEQGAKRSLSAGRSDTAIEITTIHKAKGLERKVVIVPYCNWPLQPRTAGVLNVVWSAPAGDLAEIGTVPVRFRKEMSCSLFSADYYREAVYSYVDNVNLLYVALTRAAEALYLFIPSSRPQIGQLLLDTLTHEGDRALLQDMEGSYTADDRGEHYRFGTAVSPLREAAQQSVDHPTLEGYPTCEADLRLRLPSQRIFEEEESPECSPRNFGVLMHALFEQARTMEDIAAGIERMRLDGRIAREQAEALEAEVDKVLADPVARSWFTREWDCIRTEQEIIVPGQGEESRRPDRVMLRGERAVVVDYKFGLRQSPAHREQVARYMTLLRRMGYSQVEGWLWYVRLGCTERVDEENIVSLQG